MPNDNSYIVGPPFIGSASFHGVNVTFQELGVWGPASLGDGAGLDSVQATQAGEAIVVDEQEQLH